MSKLIANKIKHGAALFDGANTFIDIGTGFGFLKTGSFTAELLIKPTSFSGTTGVNAGILGKGHYYSNTWAISIRDSGSIMLELQGDVVGGAGIIYHMGTILELNKWYHIAFTYNNGAVNFYIDSVNVYNAVYTAIGDLNNANAVNIGRRTSDSSRAFKGLIDEVRLWDYARTAQQIKDNYKKTIKPQQGLIGYYKLDGNALDSSGIGNNGILNNNVVWSVDGKVNVSQVAKFNNNTAINVASQLTIPTSNNNTATIEWWMYANTSKSTAQTIFSIQNSNWSESLSVTYGEFTFGLTNETISIFKRKGGSNTTTEAFGYSHTGEPFLNKWVHCAIVFEPTGWKLYVNGALVSLTKSTAHTADFKGFIDGLSGLSNFYIGARYTPSISDVFNGCISNFRYWNTARTQQEIQNNMFRVLSSTTTGLVEQWSLNGNLSGLNNTNGTMIGGLSFNIETPTIKADVSPELQKGSLISTNNAGLKVVNFTNSNLSYISTPTLDLVNKSFTFEYWSKLNVLSDIDHFPVMVHEASNTNKSLHIGYRLRTGGLNQIYMGFYSNDMAVTMSRPEMQKWHHFAFTYDSTTKRREIYIDGVLATSGTATSDFLGSAPLEIGAWRAAGMWGGLSLEEMRVWNYARTSTQIKDNYRLAIPVETGLIRNYKFNGNADDAINPANNGTVYGTTFFSMDKNSGLQRIKMFTSRNSEQYALKFNGTTSYAEAGTIGSVGLKDFTLGVWIKSTHVNSVSRSLISRAFYGAINHRYSISIVNGKASLFICVTTTLGDKTISSNTTVCDGKWHFITATYDRDGLAKLYVDGVFESSIDISSGAAVDMVNTFPFRIGAYNSNVGDNPMLFFPGDLAKPFMFTRLLSDAEIKDIFLTHKLPNVTELVEYWDRIATDNKKLIGVKGLVATMTDITPTLPSPAGLRSSLIFDGVDDYISLGTLPITSTANTIDFWFNLTNDTVESEGVRLFSVMSGTGIPSFRYMSDGHMQYWTGSTWLAVTNTPIPKNTWVHVALVRNATILTAYFNGIQHKIIGVGTQTYADFRLGHPYVSGATTYGVFFKGMLSNFRLHDKELSLTEVRTRMYKYSNTNTPNLVEQWKISEGTGSFAFGTKSLSGSSILGGATWTQPSNMNFIGKRVRFTGANDLSGKLSNAVHCTGDTLSLGEYGTIEAWVKSNLAFPKASDAINVNNAFRNIVVKANTTSVEYNIDWYGTTTTRVLRAVVGNTGVTVSNVDLSVDTHVAMTWTPTTLKLFINGIERQSTALTSSSFVKLPTVPVRIGGQETMSTNYEYGWDGALDEIRIWSEARTPQQILDNMNLTLDKQPNLELNMGFESNYWDTSGNAKHGTLVGNSTIEITDNTKLLLNAPIK